MALTLKEWIANDEQRVLYELEQLLKAKGIELGNLGQLREAVDNEVFKAEICASCEHEVTEE